MYLSNVNKSKHIYWVSKGKRNYVELRYWMFIIYSVKRKIKITDLSSHHRHRSRVYVLTPSFLHIHMHVKYRNVRLKIQCTNNNSVAWTWWDEILLDVLASAERLLRKMGVVGVRRWWKDIIYFVRLFIMYAMSIFLTQTISSSPFPQHPHHHSFFAK